MRITDGLGERPCRREQKEDAEEVMVAAEEDVVEEEVEAVAGVEEARTAYKMSFSRLPMVLQRASYDRDSRGQRSTQEQE